MKLDDLKWAMQGLVVAFRAHPGDCGCPQHRRLAYRPRRDAPEPDAPAQKSGEAQEKAG